MGCHIAHDHDHHVAVLYSSTSDWAFGPVFTDSPYHDAYDRAEAFMRWLDAIDWATWKTFEHELIQTGRRDPRDLTDAGLAAAYAAWLLQESDQWLREDAALFSEE